MIRRLVEADRIKVQDYLMEEPEINLFILGDIERFGFDAEVQTLWGDFEKDGQLKGVLLRYEENYIPYYKDPDYDITDFENIINVDPKMHIISGKASLTAPFQAIMDDPVVKSTYFCKLTEASHLEPYEERIQCAVPEDAGRILALLSEIDEFRETISSTEARMRENLQSGAARVYFVADQNGDLLTVAQTTAENSRSAMIVGVATRPGYRGQGLMSKCLSRLCHDLLSEGKTLCLFYDNPKAGSVYHRLGFVSMDKWLMLISKRKK